MATTEISINEPATKVAQAWKIRAQYLEAVLAAVLRNSVPEGTAVTLDVVAAARDTDVFVEAINSTEALIVWDNAHGSEKGIS